MLINIVELYHVLLHVFISTMHPPCALRMLERLSVATECSPIKLGPHMAGRYKIGTLC